MCRRNVCRQSVCRRNVCRRNVCRRNVCRRYVLVFQLADWRNDSLWRLLLSLNTLFYPVVWRLRTSLMYRNSSSDTVWPCLGIEKRHPNRIRSTKPTYTNFRVAFGNKNRVCYDLSNFDQFFFRKLSWNLLQSLLLHET